MCRNIITVTLNPSIDVALLADGLDLDKANRVLDERHEAGGKGINVSRVARAFGQETLCLCFAGEDNAPEFAGYLERENLRYEFIRLTGAIRENLMVRCAVADKPAAIKLNRKGPAVSAMMLAAMTALVQSSVKEGDIVLFGGSLPENVQVTDYVQLIRSVKNCGARIALDSDCLSLEDYRRIGPWLIKPNIHELKAILPVDEGSMDSVAAAAVTLRESGVDNVLISMGGDGLLYAGEAGRIRVTVPEVAVKSTVGAGDSTVAGFIVGTIKELASEECVRLAAACGTATAMREGTQLTDKKMARELMKRVMTVE